MCISAVTEAKGVHKYAVTEVKGVYKCAVT